jgi:hypothetical protein
MSVIDVPCALYLEKSIKSINQYTGTKSTEPELSAQVFRLAWIYTCDKNWSFSIPACQGLKTS